MSTVKTCFWIAKRLALVKFSRGYLKDPEILAELHGISYTPGTIESAALTVTSAGLFLILLSLLSEIFLPIGILLITASAVLLFLPKILLNFEKVGFLSDFLNFTIMFLISTRFMSLYHAFTSACTNAKTPVLRRALSALQLGEIKSVVDALRQIKRDSEIFGYHIPALTGLIIAELEKPEPDHSYVIKEVISAYRKMSDEAVNRFSGAMNLALGMIGLSPAILLILVPVVLGYFGINPTIGFITGSVLMFALVTLSAVILASSLPPAVVAGKVDMKLAQHILGVKSEIKKIITQRQTTALVVISIFLAILHPMFFILTGATLIIYSLPAVQTEKVISKAIRLLHEIYEALLRASGRLLRDYSFEHAFSGEGTAERLLRACVAHKVLPFGEVEAVVTLIRRMKDYGKELGKMLSEVADLFNELAAMRHALLSSLRNFRAVTVLLFFMLPFVSLMTVWIVKIFSSGQDVTEDLNFWLLSLGKANIKVVAVSTGVVSLLSSFFLAYLASYATGVYYAGKHRYYLIYAGTALLLYGAAMIFAGG